MVRGSPPVLQNSPLGALLVRGSPTLLLIGQMYGVEHLIPLIVELQLKHMIV